MELQTATWRKLNALFHAVGHDWGAFNNAIRKTFRVSTQGALVYENAFLRECLERAQKKANRTEKEQLAEQCAECLEVMEEYRKLL
jgi:hypothetical protein